MKHDRLHMIHGRPHDERTAADHYAEQYERNGLVGVALWLLLMAGIAGYLAWPLVASLLPVVRDR